MTEPEHLPCRRSRCGTCFRRGTPCAYRHQEERSELTVAEDAYRYADAMLTAREAQRDDSPR